MFICNLPPALLAEWPGSFTCHCSNRGVEQTLNLKLHLKTISHPTWKDWRMFPLIIIKCNLNGRFPVYWILELKNKQAGKQQQHNGAKWSKEQNWKVRCQSSVSISTCSALPWVSTKSIFTPVLTGSDCVIGQCLVVDQGFDSILSVLMWFKQACNSE